MQARGPRLSVVNANVAKARRQVEAAEPKPRSDLRPKARLINDPDATRRDVDQTLFRKRSQDSTDRAFTHAGSRGDLLLGECERFLRAYLFELQEDEGHAALRVCEHEA
jgi:hypothetical protein